MGIPGVRNRAPALRAPFVAGGLLAGALAAAHLLFAVANFGLTADEDRLFSAPLGEGVLSSLAAAGLAGAAVLLLRRDLYRASILAFCGTAPLPIWFAFTVPEHSDTAFLYASLVLPLAAGAAAVAAGRRRRARP